MDNGASSYRRFRDEGDESGLVEIIRDYKDGLIFYLNGIVGNIHTAEDLAEDTFVLLGTKKPRDHGKSSFRTWLYTIGRNVAIDYLRRHRKGVEVSIEEGYALVSDEAWLEETYLREERKIALHRAIRSLKPEYRQVLWLTYFEGFSNREAARVMGKSVHSLETLLYRARRSLKSQLEMEDFDDETL
ncbi:MAG: RNA polymerase sigma factor [Oscillospiraceae bacterium]|nr:RNA polymerase sigma factor [Oscillospiraceae bacterium]MBQ8732004.1 RNA polymerase sigma factor [Oscillospiraceae bacterium]